MMGAAAATDKRFEMAERIDCPRMVYLEEYPLAGILDANNARRLVCIRNKSNRSRNNLAEQLETFRGYKERRKHRGRLFPKNRSITYSETGIFTFAQKITDADRGKTAESDCRAGTR